VAVVAGQIQLARDIDVDKLATRPW
jgi:hypothetical protein